MVRLYPRSLRSLLLYANLLCCHQGINRRTRRRLVCRESTDGITHLLSCHRELRRICPRSSRSVPRHRIHNRSGQYVKPTRISHWKKLESSCSQKEMRWLGRPKWSSLSYRKWRWYFHGDIDTAIGLFNDVLGLVATWNTGACANKSYRNILLKGHI